MAIFVCFALTACINLEPRPTATVSLQESGGPGEGNTNIWVNTLLSGLKEPWGMDFLPDGRILLTEKGGTLKAISPFSFAVSKVRGVPETVMAGQGGLMDVLVHPDFASNKLIYLSYVVAEDQGYSTRVVSISLWVIAATAIWPRVCTLTMVK